MNFVTSFHELSPHHLSVLFLINEYSTNESLGQLSRNSLFQYLVKETQQSPRNVPLRQLERELKEERKRERERRGEGVGEKIDRGVLLLFTVVAQEGFDAKSINPARMISDASAIIRHEMMHDRQYDSLARDMGISRLEAASRSRLFLTSKP